MLLDDAVGTLLVLFPQSQLLDLARLTELTGRKLLAIKPERLERMLGKHELHRLPALPPLTSSPCLYDERLLQEPRLLIESGQPGILLRSPATTSAACWARPAPRASANRWKTST